MRYIEFSQFVAGRIVDLGYDPKTSCFLFAWAANKVFGYKVMHTEMFYKGVLVQNHYLNIDQDGNVVDFQFPLLKEGCEIDGVPIGSEEDELQLHPCFRDFPENNYKKLVDNILGIGNN